LSNDRITEIAKAFDNGLVLVKPSPNMVPGIDEWFIETSKDDEGNIVRRLSTDIYALLDSIQQNEYE